RLGFRQVRGLREEDVQLLVSNRTKKYSNIHELRNIGLTDTALERLADADAFNSIGLDRRQALWQVSTKDTPKMIFSGQASADEKGERVSLPQMSVSEHVVHDYASIALSLKAHPVSFVREKLTQLHIIATKDLVNGKDGDYVKVAGLVLVRQRPGTAGGICFMTIEDEFGFSNVVIFQSLFDKFRKEILQSKLIMVEGKLQIEGEVIHVIVQKCHDLSRLLRHLTPSSAEAPNVQTLAFPDETSMPPGVNKVSQVRERANEDVIPGARNFR
ncbi:MAG: OB-fold nucleic acid binding domain-containing protein, partial [Flavisolibacter sp.]